MQERQDRNPEGIELEGEKVLPVGCQHRRCNVGPGQGLSLQAVPFPSTVQLELPLEPESLVIGVNRLNGGKVVGDPDRPDHLVRGDRTELRRGGRHALRPGSDPGQ